MKYSRIFVAAAFMFAVALAGYSSSVEAATCPNLTAGDLFKSPTHSAVYYLNGAGERMYFPNGEVFETWYGSFNNVTIKTIEPVCFDNYGAGGGINYRPGSRLIKTSVSPNIYAVGLNNEKLKISDPAVAVGLYGANWEKLIRIIPDVFDANYSVGEPITEIEAHPGQIFKRTDHYEPERVFYRDEDSTKIVTGPNGLFIDDPLPDFLKPDVREFTSKESLGAYAGIKISEIYNTPPGVFTYNVHGSFSFPKSVYGPNDTIEGTLNLYSDGDEFKPASRGLSIFGANSDTFSTDIQISGEPLKKLESISVSDTPLYPGEIVFMYSVDDSYNSGYKKSIYKVVTVEDPTNSFGLDLNKTYSNDCGDPTTTLLEAIEDASDDITDEEMKDISRQIYYDDAQCVSKILDECIEGSTFGTNAIFAEFIYTIKGQDDKGNCKVDHTMMSFLGEDSPEGEDIAEANTMECIVPPQFDTRTQFTLYGSVHSTDMCEGPLKTKLNALQNQ